MSAAYTEPYMVKTVEERAAEEYDRMRAREYAQERIAVEKAAKTPTRMGRRHIAEVVAQAVEEVQVTHEYGVQGLASGIPSLDPFTRRAFRPGMTIINVGNTKSGKTAFLGNLLVSFACQGVPVLLFSFEDDQADTAKRYIAGLTAGDVGAIRDGFIRPDGSKAPIPESFDEGATALTALGIEVAVEHGTVEQIAYEVGHWTQTTVAESQLPFGVVFVDQLGHVIPSDPAVFKQRFPGYPPPPSPDRKIDMLEWQVAMLQRIARKWNVLMIINHQMNENHAEWERPTERSVRDSRGIVHKADAVIAPWRPSKLPNPAAGHGEPKWVENTEGRAFIIGIVGRAIEPFTLEVQWNGAQQRFLDLAANPRQRWTAPAAFTAEQAVGVQAMAALRGRWNADSVAIRDHANQVEGVSVPAARPVAAIATEPVALDPERFVAPVEENAEFLRSGKFF